jgi:hypothetical protein
LLCTVIFDSATVDLSSPECLKEFHVLETFVNRWVPNENRGDGSSGGGGGDEINNPKTSKADNRASTQNLFEFYDSD